MGTAEQNTDNAPIAFVLVICAGLSTAIGAAVVFNQKLVKLASKRFLAGSLGLAAGVMLYVSLVEIFVKSQDSFANHGFSEADSYLYATLSLFGGVLLYKGIDLVVHLLEGGPVRDHHVDISLYDLDGSSGSSESSPRTAPAATADKKKRKKSAPQLGGANSGNNPNDGREPFPADHNVVVELASRGSAVRPSPDLNTLQLSMAGKVQAQQPSPVSELTPSGGGNSNNKTGVVGFMEEGSGVDQMEEAPSAAAAAAAAAPSGTVQSERGTPAVADGDNEKLVRMGLLTAVAIGIHNFPEGLATFVAALSDPSVGLALAVAIGIHNIPEGLCVAIPVYYATGNRWKAFGWALLSGVSEPIGAGLGWLILKDIMSELVYGLLFGVVAGMMVNITIHELIPTAVRYDPTDKVTTNSIIAGMAIMALSLTLFLY
ncbi:Zinc transporter zupT, Zinc transporter ZIP, metal ion transmembrane transporter activity [Ectocarpus siliculosus]|uniref:Zinc transporter zupT, Zinc transporter ZIP, metal ion transmembrane transporter activity n=1 Tax=Ectocarpus siliculosus TaxID=2880 RepID=D8LCW7_ECTSI|nr:Zinc transporter zupT, Zinc transporter ZIP, metal ion transmembrane transporter activity [Ectocarpus siliculosus]|eukprot:CBN75509.1 Zinc transporter zupT, Zinc transporter ZIP, metal ion transmembrane transporter activity [Ectocarpus siliculosus]